MQIQTSPLILTFGPADPVGALGIQADLASFAAMGCHGLSVITGLMIGDTARIEDLQVIEADWVADQARVVLEDMPVAAFKVGAVTSVENVSVIAEIVSDYPDIPLILDPFLTGMPEQAIEADDIVIAMRELLIPQTTLLVLSALELARLAETWREPADPADPEAGDLSTDPAAQSSADDALMVDAMRIIEMGCEYLFVTGTPSDVHDVANSLFNETGLVRRDQWQRVSGTFTGAGSTLSATAAAMMANGLDVPEAVFEAQEFVMASIAHAQRLGMGKLIPDRYFWARDTEPGH